MNKLSFLLLALILFLSPAKTSAQQNIDTTKSLLWEISGNGLSKPSWIFGTMHVVQFCDFVWTEQLQECFEKADNVSFEIIPDSTDISNKVTTLKSWLKIARTCFTKEEYKLVRSYILKNKYIDIGANSNKTLIQLTVILLLNHDQDDIEYKAYLTRAANKKHKKISGLETITDQIDAVSQTSEKTIANDIVAIASYKASIEDEKKQKVAAFKNQDQYLTYKLNMQRSLINDLQNASLANKRNHNWIPHIEAMAKDASVFFTVGAAHLGGENGLISLLRKEGYTLTPVMSDATNSLSNFKPAAPSYDIDYYLSNNVHYPREALVKKVQGTVIIGFTIQDDGSITDCILRKRIGAGCDEEALNVIKSMPSWTPGVMNYIPLRTHQSLKVTFTLPAEN